MTSKAPPDRVRVERAVQPVTALPVGRGHARDTTTTISDDA